jgi:transmembrane sensor
MTQIPDPIMNAAAGWMARTGDADFADWEEFTAWLEDDPVHADAYHAIAGSADTLMPVVAELPPPRIAPAVTPARRWPWAVAAGVAAFGALGIGVAPQLRGQVYSTAPGEMRTVALADGDSLVLNGGTQIRLAAFDRRDIRLERGQLLLQLHGSDGGQVTVRSGDLELVDVGTVFEVSRDAASTRVLVSEGAVVADPDGAKLRIGRGQKLEAADGASVLQAQPALTGSAGAWRRGQLVYLDAPLSQVAADLQRSTGIDFSVSTAMGQRRFSGTLSIAAVRRDPASLGPLLDTALIRTDGGWRMGERP